VDAKNLVGTTLDSRYDITRIIGQGGMGAVYEAQHSGTGRRVAVKVISTGDLTKDAALVGRFQREAKAAGAVDTQHICQVIDTGTDKDTGWPYMVMEYMVGEDVQQLLRRVGPLASDIALRIVAQSCVGLQKAHDAGVVHRDIKPANLFLAKNDSSSVLVKLLDFGIAKVKMEHASEVGDAGLTRTGTMLGSPLYMSPEQARGVKTIDHRADIWSLGVVLYELLTGRTPFHHIEALGELIIAICSEPPRPVQDFASWVTPEVAAVVHKALKANVADRFQSAAEMLDAIKPLLQAGMSLEEGQLVSLSETHKQMVAKRLTMPPPPGPNSLPPPQVAAQSVPPPGLTQETSTTGGVSAPTERRPQAPQKSNVTMIVAGAALSVAVLGGIGLKLMGGTADSANASNATPPVTALATSTGTATSGPATATPTIAPVPDANAETRTVKLVIIPEEAEVKVDGLSVKVKKGAVEITGKPGTVHKVTLTIGKDTIEEEVVVTDSGALPPKLELEPKKGGGVGVKPATTGAAPGTAAPTTPKGIDTSFQ
jgi:eukaryotic-like serine/threonine-protein kinase